MLSDATARTWLRRFTNYVYGWAVIDGLITLLLLFLILTNSGAPVPPLVVVFVLLGAFSSIFSFVLARALGRGQQWARIFVIVWATGQLIVGALETLLLTILGAIQSDATVWMGIVV